jgi:hypothetical protein
MKPIIGSVCLAIAIMGAVPLKAQAPQQKEKERLTAIILELQTQQKEMAENQAKIDEKLAKLAETIREARIFSSRGGR